MITVSQIAKLIDHSILHPTYTDKKIEEECMIAIKYAVASVCVKPYAVMLSQNILNGSGVKVGCVVGFPHGNSSIEVKIYETEKALADGAQEIDMVINIARALEKNYTYLYDEIRFITECCHDHGAIVKVIFETDYIQDTDVKIKLCEICNELNVDFVKTSTGYGFVKLPNGLYTYQGATIEDIRLFRKYCHSNIQIKASGGIRTLDDVLAFYEAGATRIGATATEQIIAEATKRFV